MLKQVTPWIHGTAFRMVVPSGYGAVDCHPHQGLFLGFMPIAFGIDCGPITLTRINCLLKVNK